MTHQELARIADAAYTDARARAGSWIVCHSGCDSCCKRPFAITFEDARQLSAGLLTLPGSQQDEICARARAALERFAEDFPGDLVTGELTEREDWQAWFFARHSGVPCPVLDLESGACLLYEHRPIACRLYGPLIQIGSQTSDPCPLCYPDASPQQVASTRVRVELPETPEAKPDTVIAWALAR